jgi:ABC-type transporter Mla subunit MlaD
VLISSTFSANTQTLDTALQEFGTFSTNLQTILSNNGAEIDRLINNLDLLTTDVVAPNLGELDHALKGIDEAAKHVFLSARLGEWLNEAILCAGNGPPPAGTGCATPIVKEAGSNPATPSSSSSSSAPAPSLPAVPSNIGGAAPSTASGAAALEQWLLGPVKQ